MKKLIISLAFGAVLAPSVVWACEGEDKAIQSVSTQIGRELQEKKAATFVDANNARTRSEFGVVPGAILLTSYDSYAATELPANKAQGLVFYCAAEQCGAAKGAAGRAIEAGYENVRVMPEGIKGWKKAGLPTAAISAPKKADKQS